MIPKQRATHVPERTCVTCRQVKPKKELIRVVRTTAGTLEIDLTGRKGGRGAYLCHSRDCWEAGIKKQALERALRGKVGEADRKQLMSYAEDNLQKGA